MKTYKNQVQVKERQVLKLLYIIPFLFFLIINTSYGQQINVDINLNIKHSVEGVSDFGRERHMTIHSTPTENDWKGEEDKLDYLINDLGVFFGRETGSATWKMQAVEQDPNNSGWPNESQMIVHGNGLKNWSSSSDFALLRQYKNKTNNMIMGINDTSPMYPNLSWFTGFGKGKEGWFVKDVDAAAEWVTLYLDHYFAKSPGDIGDPLPKYWEVYNEPDMNFMNPQFGMIISSLEKNWEYHKLVAQNVKERLGNNAPKIGGMTWGQLDFYKPDGIPTRSKLSYWTQWLKPDNPMIPVYENMLSGVNGWPKAWDKRQDNWWQWDYLWQGFIDYAGADMDFYGVHIYDWPNENAAQTTIRSGGHTEAMLDQLEWYDNFKFGAKKDIVISEFGAVNTNYINSLPDRRRDWEFLKPFNQMFMEILERPSHLVMSMPFTPAKAVWGAHIKDNGDVQRYDGSTLFEPVGSWKGNKDTYVIGEPSGGWQWSPIIYYFELWKDVDGTRIDTKSSNIDVQVDAYVKDKHVYVILNNTDETVKTINLNTFNAASANTVSSVEMRHLFFNPNLGSQGEPDLTVVNLQVAPTQVTLKPNSTIVLDYTYANTLEINKESKEAKYMSEPLTTAKNSRGTQLCRLEGKNKFTTTIKNVVKPSKGEAMFRVGGFFYNPTDGGNGTIKVISLKVNGNEVVTTTPMLHNPRGHVASVYGGGWFGVLEIEVPIEFLKDGDNTVFFERQQNADFTTAILQVWDMDQDPGRSSNTTIPLTAISIGSDAESLMNGNNLGIVPVFTPENASNKGVTWTSSDTTIATVDENGVVTAIANSGVTVITATSNESASILATKTITAIPYETATVTAIEILEGEQITVDQYVNTPLTLQLNPAAENAPEIEWTSSNESIASVLATGKVIGKTIGGTATITAKVKGTNISDAITVHVRIAGEESIFTRDLPDFLRPFTTGKVSVPINVMGARTVIMELIKDGIVLGSGTKNVNILGSGKAEIIYNLAEAPTPDTNYTIKLTLKDGSTILDTETKTIEIKDHIRVSSVLIENGISTVQVGETIVRTATAKPEDAFHKNIVWSSSNTAVATINNTTGVIAGVSVGETVIRATSADVNTIYDEVTITVQSGIVSIPIESISIPSSIHLFQGLSKTLPINLLPEFTTEVDVIWTSNNNKVSVDQNGMVTAGFVDGNATIKATSVNNPNVFASCIVNVSKTIFIEAETFVNTGGASNGVVKSSIGFNNNTSGDWAEYIVDIPSNGSYEIKYNIGSPNSLGLGVKTYVDGELLNTTTLAGTGAWDTYTIQSGSSEISINEGTHTIRFESTGTDEWQWNADWFSLTFTGTLSVGDSEISNISVFPNPTRGNIMINGLNGVSTIIIFTIQGRKLEQIKTSKEKVTLNLNSYNNGLYLIKVVEDKSKFSNLYKILKK